MRVLKIVNSEDRGGVLVCEIQFINELISRRIQVDLVILGNGDSGEIYKSIATSWWLIPSLRADYSGSPMRKAVGVLKTFYFGHKYSTSLTKNLKNRYDAIIFQVPTFMFLTGMLSKKLGVPVYWHMASSINSAVSKAIYVHVCKTYNIIPIANSAYTRKTMKPICRHVVYPGFDETRIVKTHPTVRKSLNIKKDIPIYGIAARIHYTKAQDIIVEAFVESDLPKSGVHLVIAGGPLDSEFAEKTTRIAGRLLGDKIHFLGEINGSLVPEFYSSVDIVINGRRDVEPFGISVAEGLAAGKPVIAYKLGGPTEMIKHDVNGWLVEFPSVDQYKKILNYSLQRKNSWRKMGESAKIHSAQFSVKRNVDELLRIISSKQE